MNLNKAKETLADWQQKVVWKRSFGRPFRMQEIQVEALLATWEALADMKANRSDIARCRELRRRCEELSNSLSLMDGMPVMTRSFEHRVSLEQARWALSVLTLALELWDALDKGASKEAQGERKTRSYKRKTKA